MEPGIVAAAYAVETAVEGAAVGALAIAQSTVPLKARFYRLPSPSPVLTRSSHTLNVIKGRGYIFGGDGEGVGKGGDDAMHVLTLPTDLVLKDTDYQKISAVARPSKAALNAEGEAEKKSAGKAQSGDEEEEDDGNNKSVPAARAGHTASVIGNRIYIFGGRPARSSDADAPPNAPLQENGKVYVFEATEKTWRVLVPNEMGCSDDVPQPRNYASSSSTIHPLPIRNEEGTGRGKDELMTDEAKLRLVARRQGEDFTATDDQQSEGYGTLFLHGGYDAEGKLLRDAWAFDVASRIWSRWADVPSSDGEDGDGNICCIESKLWRCGDDFGKVAHFDIVRDEFDDMSGKGELGVGPKTGEWKVHTFGVKPGQEKLEKQVEEKMGGKPTNTESLFPARRKRSGFIPVTTGQGRDYLLLVMGEKGPQEVVDDIWSFQIPSEKKSAAAIKDTIRTMIGKGTGVEQWAKADIVESDKEEGMLDYPRGLSRFGSSPAGDAVGDVVIWGGIGPEGEVSADGWILTLE
ncbi:hypothetical protein GJ744_008654 [Endocarpon pusillum]|uniref:Uncharacterized protein n=1 Tax=Endocarpon pusillum TaxID=364733 RepID=A0A8H7AKS5_9EURO|nr:hypothetical protein GJ744_008654 [Endocarpon pusillum]